MGRITIALFSIGMIGPGCRSVMVGDTAPVIAGPASEQDRVAVAYMVRGLLSTSEQQRLLEQIGQGGAGTGPSELPTLAGVAGATALRQSPLSSSGVTTVGAIAAGITILDAFGPDGSSTSTSSLYLPQSVGDQKFTSVDEAESFGRTYVRQRLDLWAQRVGRHLECVNECDGRAPTYRAVKVTNARLPFHDPAGMLITAFQRPLLPAVSDKRRDSILGFEAKWQSSGAKGVGLCVVSYEVGKEPETKPVRDPKLGNYLEHSCRTYYAYPIERELLRILTSDGYYTMGRTWAGSNVAAMKGHVFEINQRHARDFIGREIDPATDRPFLP
jgi:hypothetical protein